MCGQSIIAWPIVSALMCFSACSLTTSSGICAGNSLPLLFEDHDKTRARARRKSVVQPAQRSESADNKAATKRNQQGLPVHSFRSLIAHLSTLTLNQIQTPAAAVPSFFKLTTPTQVQKKAFSLLGLR